MENHPETVIVVSPISRTRAWFHTVLRIDPPGTSPCLVAHSEEALRLPTGMALSGPGFEFFTEDLKQPPVNLLVLRTDISSRGLRKDLFALDLLNLRLTAQK